MVFAHLFEVEDAMPSCGGTGTQRDKEKAHTETKPPKWASVGRRRGKVG